MSAFAAKRIRHLFECCDGRRIPLNAEERSTRRGEVPYWGANSIVDFVDEALFDEELVLLGEDGAPFQDRDQPKAFRINGPVWPNNHIHVLRPLADTHARFMAYAMNHIDYSPYIDGSTRDKLTQSAMSDIKLPCPPSHEQTRIANFLDEQTARIDALIAEKERLDALLGEYRGSLISAAVTGCLDVSAGTAVPKTEKRNEPVTDCQLKHLASMKSGESISSDEILQDGPYPVYGGNGLRGYTGNYTHAQTGPLIGRQGALCGNVTFVSGAFWATEHAVVATPREGVWPRWLFWLLEGLDLNQYSVAAAQPGLAVEALTRVRTVKPQFSTQVRIANFLDERTAQIDNLRSHCREHIALLREYRSSLISAAVTGQLDIDNFKKGVA